VCRRFDTSLGTPTPAHNHVGAPKISSKTQQQFIVLQQDIVRIVLLAVLSHILGILAMPTTILMGYTDYVIHELFMEEFMVAHTRQEGTVVGLDRW
jgi:hypothetical protein